MALAQISESQQTRQIKVSVIEPMSVAEGSCSSTSLLIESQQTKEDKVSTINPILGPEVLLLSNFHK